MTTKSNASDLLDKQRDEILHITTKHGVTNVRIFGSVVRGEDRPGSDIDFLVTPTKNTSPWFPAGLILDLEEILDRDVEIVTDVGLNPFLRDQILAEAQIL